MSYQTEYDLFADTTNDLHKKVARAITKAVTDVLAEDAGTQYHAGRVQWAQAIRDDPNLAIVQAHKIILRVLENSTIAAAGNTALDGDVLFVVFGLVDIMAHVT